VVVDITSPFAPVVTAVDVVPPVGVGAVVVIVDETRLPVRVVVTAVEVITPSTGGRVVVVTIYPFGSVVVVTVAVGAEAVTGAGAGGIIACVGGGNNTGILPSELLFAAMRGVPE
jgi:hypothetical protein